MRQITHNPFKIKALIAHSLPKGFHIKKLSLLFLPLACALMASPVPATAETLTLSTYYPAPFGAYDRLRLVPSDGSSLECTDQTLGTFYVDEADNTIRLCSDTQKGYKALSTVWKQNGNYLYPTDFANPDLYVGIGTSEPKAKLHIKDEGADIKIGRTPNVNDGITIYTPSTEGKIMLTNSLTTDPGTDGSTLLFLNDTDGPRGLLWASGAGSPEEGFMLKSFNGPLRLQTGFGNPPEDYQDRIVIDHLTGNVGIGTTNPQRKLEIAGPGGVDEVGEDAVRLRLTTTKSGDQAPGIELKNADNDSGNKISKLIARDGSAFSFEYSASNENTHYTGNNLMTINPNGYVGIGSMNPWCHLLVKDIDGNNFMSFCLGNTPIMTVQSYSDDGNRPPTIEGMQLTGEYNSPGKTLANRHLLSIIGQGRSSNTKWVTGAKIDFLTEAAYTDDSHPTAIVFSPGKTGILDVHGNYQSYKEAMRITSDGNVGIGTSNPGAKLEVAGSTVINGTTTLNGEVVIIENVGMRKDAWINRHLFVGGNLNVDGVFSNPSDERLKKNIQPLNNSLEKVLTLNGVNFLWKDPEKEQSQQVGLIAQNVETVFPELVRTDSGGFKSVAYANLVAPLIEAIKEQQQMIDDLRKEVEALKAQE